MYMCREVWVFFNSTSKRGLRLHSLCLTTPAGQCWLGGASHLSTFGRFHLYDIGCMESTRWAAEGATIVCAGLAFV